MDEAGEPEDEEDEAAYYDDAGEEHALGDEDEHEDDEGDCEGGDGDLVGEEPVWVAKSGQFFRSMEK